MTLLDDCTEQSLRLAAVGALLHNLGKVSDKFLKKQIHSQEQNYLYQHIVGLIFPHAASLSPISLSNRFSPAKQTASDILEPPTREALAETSFCLPFPLNDRVYVVGDLIEYLGQGKGKDAKLYIEHPGVGFGIELIFPCGSRLTHLMNRAHRGASGGEKENIAAANQPNAANVFSSTPFGYETPALSTSNIEDWRKQQIERVLQEHFPPTYPYPLRSFIAKMYPLLSKAVADARRPFNDVSVGDIGYTGMAFLLTQATQWILTGRTIDHHELSQTEGNNTLLWRLLTVHVDSLHYLEEALSLADLRVRQQNLRKAFLTIQQQLEDTLLAMEIYADEQRHIFVIPDLQQNHPALEALKEIISATKIDDLLRLESRVSESVTNHPKDAGRMYIGDQVLAELQVSPPYEFEAGLIDEIWKGESAELCTACGLRPQGYGADQIDAYKHNPAYYRKKARERGLCCICMENRRGVSEQWVKDSLGATVWVDEVADSNHRLALVVGKLETRKFIEAFFYPRGKDGSQDCWKPDHSSNTITMLRSCEGAPNPSFARLRRIWETTRRFWQDVAPTDAPPEELVTFCQNYNLNLEDLWEGPLSLEESLAGQAIGEKRSRLFLKAKNAGAIARDLGPFHAYEMMVNGRKVAVLWVPPDAVDEKGEPLENRGGFWVLENLNYLENENVFGRPLEGILQTEVAYDIYEPSEYGKVGESVARFILKEHPERIAGYIPLIPILAEPRTFMALVPADKAIEVVEAIRTKYEREMGKVRNRLPLHLGIVYADAHTPLRAILDAGKRMLKQMGAPAGWKVKDKRQRTNAGGTLPKRFVVDAHGQFAEWLEIDLAKEGREITWYVPAVMGDGKTEDNWYPYAFLAQTAEPTGRKRYYKAENKNPWNKHHPWLVHVGDLKQGDIIYFTPATLDFQWLGSSASRFEIAYDENGQRRGALHRPYLLDELDDLVECWTLLAGDREKHVERLGTSQLHAVRDLIETKRMEWFSNPQDSLSDETFRNFCKSVLINAQWNTKPSEEEMKRLTHWAATGLLADAVELFHHIMKQEVSRRDTGSTEE